MIKRHLVYLLAEKRYSVHWKNFLSLKAAENSITCMWKCANVLVIYEDAILLHILYVAHDLFQKDALNNLESRQTMDWVTR
jgi:hypothetical protein